MSVRKAIQAAAARLVAVFPQWREPDAPCAVRACASCPNPAICQQLRAGISYREYDSDRGRWYDDSTRPDIAKVRGKQ